MLILSRRVGEALKIGDDVWVEIREIDQNQVKIGIAAPKSVSVMREELLPDDEKRQPRQP